MPPDWSHPLLSLPMAWGLLVIVFALLWVIQLRTKDATSVDVAWSGSIGVVALLWLATGQGAAPQRWLGAALVAVWSGRLTWHLTTDRLLRGAGEDGRYRAMRSHFGERAALHFFWFYQLQGLVALAFAAPFLALATHSQATIAPVQWLGAGVFAVAQLLESTADRQLATHRADPASAGRACRRGLWRYSRHPNYFFEWVSWCGISLCVWPAAGWAAALQPLLMFVLVRFVSGVPFAEQQSLRSRGADYQRYQKETNAFVPWWPKRTESTVNARSA